MTTTVNVTPCPHCGMLHGGICHLVKAIEYYPDGTVKRIEFKGPADYPQATIVNPPLPLPSTWGPNLTGAAPMVPNGTCSELKLS